MSIPQVELLCVSKNYGNNQFKALREVSTSFEKGEFVALMGPSGCGKSTLLNLIAGIDYPSDGKVVLEGQDLSVLSDEQKTKLRSARIGFIFQFFNLLSTLTVKENVLIPLEIAGNLNKKEAFSKLDRLLENVGLTHRSHYYPSQLSGGEMQRTAIARALINSPAIILADEPTGNLDTENGIKVLELLRDANVELGLTILLATHSAEAASYATRQLHMKDGVIIGS